MFTFNIQSSILKSIIRIELKNYVIFSLFNKDIGWILRGHLHLHN